jgi:hypothetical protein
MRRRRQNGQAAVETVAVVAALGVLTLAGWQVVVAAYAWQAAQGAARTAARAGAVGAPVGRAALGTLPAGLARRASVRAGGDGSVSVQIRVPAVLPGAAALVGEVTATAEVGP